MKNVTGYDEAGSYEFCPRCEANITFQKGYSNKLPYWVCLGCGEMLINPEIDSNVVWICDGCGAYLSLQDGFSEDCGTHICTECGYENRVDKREIYLSDEEFKADFYSPYYGLSDEAALELSLYNEEYSINNRDDIIVVRNQVDDRLYVKKILSTYDVSVYEYLKEHPLEHMPTICEVYESKNNLIVIEEFINGKTVLEMVDESPIELFKAIHIAESICQTVKQLHELEKPIIHRDIKPSNVIVKNDGEVVLLDINVAKWYDENEIEDTRLFGTRYYAAPEQMGYGFFASSEKTDIYAIGMLLNVMITGRLPKEEKALPPVWPIIEKCISLEPENRFTDEELIEALDNLQR